MSLEAEEERGVDLPDETEDQSASINMHHAMVGKFLTDKHIKFDYMQQVLASVWRPVMGMRVKEIKTNLFVFQFFHEKDISRVIENGPWGFENYTLVCKRLNPDDIPEKTTLHFLDIWVQIHDLPCGYMSEKIAGIIGDHVGIFISSDPNNFLGGWRNFLRIRTSIDVREPLKKMMKLKKKDGSCFWISFKYERLHTFCYFCGLLGHSMQFCRKYYGVKTAPEELPFGAWLRAKPRPTENRIGERWIIEEGCTGRAEDYKDKDATEQTEDTEELHRSCVPSQLNTKSLNIETQDDAVPTLDYKRRRSNSSSTETQTDINSLNEQVVRNYPASPAGQARYKQ